MDRSEQRRLVEALVLGSPEPIPVARLADLVPRAKPALVRALVDELNAEYAEQRRAFEIWEVAGGYQVRTLPEFAPYLQQLKPLRPLRLSAAALETLAVVAYRQPVTRAEVENVRGVDAGPVLRSLLERGLVRIAGHREVPGRPLLYGTTRRFLEVFGLARVEDLPRLRDVAELAGGEEAVAVVGGDPEDAAGDDAPEDADAEASESVSDDAIAAFHDAEPVGKPH